MVGTSVSSSHVPELLRLLALRVAGTEEPRADREQLSWLLYLTEVEYYREHGRRLTELTWVCGPGGPYAPGIERAFQLLPDAADGSDLPEDAALAVHCTRERWAGMTPARLTDHICFETEPMEDAVIGSVLDFALIPRPEESFRPVGTVAPALRERLAHVESPFRSGDGVPVRASEIEPPEDEVRWDNLPLARIAEALNSDE